jgi:hypothetical protein
LRNHLPREAVATVRYRPFVPWQVYAAKPEEYLTARGDLEQVLARSTGSVVKKAVTEYFRSAPAVKVSVNFDVFPAERQKVAATVLAHFDAERADDKNASVIMLSLHTSVLLALCPPAVATTTADSIVCVAGDVAGVNGLSEKLLCAVAQSVATAEKSDNGFTGLFRREVMAAVTMRVTELFAHDPYGEGTCNLGLHEDAAGKFIIKRLGEAVSRVKLPFYGRVVEEAAASMAPRCNVLPLGPVGVGVMKGPKLFLDGSSFQNPKKTDVSFAFMVPRMPKPSVESEEPAKKKAKSQSKTQTSQATHIVEYDEFDVTVGSTKLTYRMPFLVDRKDFADVEGKCLRAYESEWDDLELAKPARSIVNKVAFILK